jgi:hypothetical protein
MAEINKNNCTIERDSHFDRERYFYDKNLSADWKQYDTEQDAPYFGVWVNIKEMKIVSFAEGDETIAIAPTLKAFKAELESMADFYGPPPPAFKVIDSDGALTHYFDERPTVEGGAK